MNTKQIEDLIKVMNALSEILDCDIDSVLTALSNERLIKSKDVNNIKEYL